MEKEDKINRCKGCGSTLTYIRLTSKERVCRNCGHIEDIREKRTVEHQSKKFKLNDKKK